MLNLSSLRTISVLGICLPIIYFIRQYLIFKITLERNEFLKLRYKELKKQTEDLKLENGLLKIKNEHLQMKNQSLKSDIYNANSERDRLKNDNNAFRDVNKKWDRWFEKAKREGRILDIQTVVAEAIN